MPSVWSGCHTSSLSGVGVWLRSGQPTQVIFLARVINSLTMWNSVLNFHRLLWGAGGKTAFFCLGHTVRLSSWDCLCLAHFQIERSAWEWNRSESQKEWLRLKGWEKLGALWGGREGPRSWDLIWLLYSEVPWIGVVLNYQLEKLTMLLFLLSHLSCGSVKCNLMISN